MKDLLETNIRQRGIGNPNPIKLGKCLKELDRILDFKSGNNQYSASEKFSAPTTQSDYYEGLAIDERTTRNYKKLTELVPELQDWVETGIVFMQNISFTLRMRYVVFHHPPTIYRNC